MSPSLSDFEVHVCNCSVLCSSAWCGSAHIWSDIGRIIWVVLYICSSYQGFRHGRLFLNFCGSFSFPHIDLGSTLVQDVAVLKQSGINMVTAAQDRRKAFAQGLLLKPCLTTPSQAPVALLTSWFSKSWTRGLVATSVTASCPSESETLEKGRG